MDSIPNVTATELQQRARSWIATVFNSAQDVVQLDDVEAHRIIAKGSFGVEWMDGIAQVHSTLTLEFKEGRFRYTLTGFGFQGKQWPTPLPLENYKDMKWGWDKVIDRTAIRSEKFIEDLKQALRVDSPVGGDNW